MSQKSFADLGVSRAVAAALRDRGVHTPFPIQELVIADVLAGRDVLAKSPTGSGKTLAFGAPLVDRIAADARRPAALVLAPTRELAGQIVDELRPLARSRNLSVAATIRSTAGRKPMSSMRSASSSTRVRIRSSRTARRAIRSSSRPGVATRMSARLHALICFSKPTPP